MHVNWASTGEEWVTQIATTMITSWKFISAVKNRTLCTQRKLSKSIPKKGHSKFGLIPLFRSSSLFKVPCPLGRSLARWFLCSLVCSFVFSLVRLFVRCFFVRSFVRLFVRLFLCSFVDSSFFREVPFSLVLSFSRSLVRLFLSVGCSEKSMPAILTSFYDTHKREVYSCELWLMK